MKYEKPSVTVDIVVFYENKVLLIKRKNEPFKGMLALPGGFVNANEPPSRAAYRELREETRVRWYPSLLGVYGERGRDPRGWTISIAYWGILDKHIPVKGGDDASSAKYYDIEKAERFKLAFDHNNILHDALVRKRLHETYSR